MELTKAKKISRTAVAKSLLDLPTTRSKTDEEMLVIESLLSLGSDNVPECPKSSSPCSDSCAEHTANLEPLCSPESPKENRDGDNNAYMNKSFRPQESEPQNVSTQV